MGSTNRSLLPKLKRSDWARLRRRLGRGDALVVLAGEELDDGSWLVRIESTGELPEGFREEVARLMRQGPDWDRVAAGAFEWGLGMLDRALNNPRHR